MRVRIMTWLPAAAGFLAVSAIADTAAAQCGPTCPPPPPPCCEPPPPPPPPPPCCEIPPPPPCCGGGGNLNVNVNVNASANAGARAGLNARAGGTVFVGGGGSAYVTVDQPYPTTINGLLVEGERVRQTIRVPYESRRRMEKRVVIQAVCIDDRNVPHPASQVRPDREVNADYEGELYRCMAGTWLQMTWAEYTGEVRFDQGQTMSCRKGEALWHGRGGNVECRTQRAERECNERSLLRRYGAGVKILTMVREELYTEYREEVVEQSGVAVSGASITLDGGVGGRVF
ncbi:hypothetical protein [Brevundimonas lenta]|uniref:Uncharacterized protein n=1 Tax=Brevundimonas lenta TaxID=424796 RepID=A0A7W6NQD3_9CAUL|nr:hypothetical protein [Brevundimonas lenta]MBB4083778.1 hypothetical protein [Brevundimonas lenta]